MKYRVLSEPFSIHDCRIIELNKISDERGNLTFVEGGNHIPFEIKRVYYIYDVHAGSQRAGHAHKTLFQYLIPVSGSFDVHIDDAFEQRTITLNRPYLGLLITPFVWRIIDNFSSGSVCLALASASFEEADYFRHYDDFVRAAHQIRAVPSVDFDRASLFRAEA